MQCYVCAERGTETPAVALCHSCHAGLCAEHLREAAERFASDSMLAGCHHDTWSVDRGHRHHREAPVRRSSHDSRPAGVRRRRSSDAEPA